MEHMRKLNYDCQTAKGFCLAWDYILSLARAYILEKTDFRISRLHTQRFCNDSQYVTRSDNLTHPSTRLT